MSSDKKPKLLDTILKKMAEYNYSPKTTKIYINWIKRFIIFNKKQHPIYLNEKHISKFLNHLVLKENLSYSSQRQALSAILFLYLAVLEKYLIPDNFIWVNKSMNKKEELTNTISLKSNGSKLKVFLCHANEDKPIIRKLYKKLKKNEVQPWFDDEDLIGGQEWELEIEKAVSNSDIVIVCLSNKSITKAGYVQKEIKFALDVADRQPEDSIFIIPLRLEDCLLPQRLKKWQAIDSFRRNGFEKLKKSLIKRTSSL
jgi:hypothetical protein